MTQPSSFDPFALLTERTAEVDRAVLEAAAATLFSADVPEFALLAVGGYGRRQLFPYSDVDLLLLFPSERAAIAHKSEISAFLQRLWDGGMRVSQSVRTPEECLQVHDQNAELNISLLERFYLAGDRALYDAMDQKLPRFVHANRNALVANLAGLTRDRHAKFADTFYHLEPNVKETPGGLRDFQLIRWLEQLRGAPDAEPSPELLPAFEHFARVRWWLHTDARRDQNVLSFDAQDALAEQSDDGGPAEWMRRHYRHARAIYRAATRELETVEAQTSGLFASFRDWRSRLGNADIGVRRERAHFREPRLLEADPDLALRLFEFVARHGIPPSLDAARRIEAQLGALEAYFGGSRPSWPALTRMFTLPHAALALRSMHETGALCAFFPELKSIECQVIRDFYHRYTVDEHTMVAIERLLKPQDPYAGLLAEAGQLGALVFATLFHDSGKGDPDNGHVDGSVRLAEAAMTRLGTSAADRETVHFLIAKHLVLSATMQSRDVFDPQTIQDVAAQMQTVERLKALTLLTYADISAVNPTAMTAWRAEQLWQLYLAVYNELTRSLETDRIESAPALPPERAAFLEGFPTRYLRTHTEAEIAGHEALEAKARARGAAVEVRKVESAWQLTLAATDHPGLFASAAGTLSGFGLNILRAEAFGNRRGMVLDTFTFADPLRNLELNPTEVDRLRSTAERVLTGRLDVKTLLRNRPKPAPPSSKSGIPGQVSFNSDASRTATLIEIVAQDRPGLLYDLTSAISSHGANIEVVLIDTEAHKAIDVFYVTANGKKLTPETQSALAESLREAAG
jgi:[protein-PII] uridylyltransferase